MKFDFSKYRNIVTADFETSTPKWFDLQYQELTYGIKHSESEVARIWAWDICSLIKDEYTHETGTNIGTFIERLSMYREGTVVCFHNLAFDGSYILSYLLSHGYGFLKIYSGKRLRYSKNVQFTDIKGRMRLQ